MKKYLFPLLLSVAAFSTVTLAQDSDPSLPTYISNEKTQGSLKHFFYDHWIKDNSPIAKTNLNTIQTTNTSTTTVNGKTIPTTQAPAIFAKQKTTDNLDNTLKQFFYSMYQDDSSISKKIQAINSSDNKNMLFKEYLLDNSVESLTIGKNANADDSLYVSSGDVNASTKSMYLDNKKYLEKPTSINNANFNFATLITPVAYDANEKNAAENFLKYSAQSTTDFAKGLNLSRLYENGQLNAAALLNLKKQSTYQNYQFQLRSLLAVRSMLINSLNLLIAERTPVVGLASAAGIPTLANNGTQAEISKLPKFEQKESAKNEASPLQVEAYQANHRIENPAWYARIGNERSAAVQRETLIVLAEIEHQNYEAHLDRERLLSAITALGLQNNTQQTHTMTTEETSKIQAAVKQAIDSTRPKPTKK